jgi:uncharacterized protein YktB (UPF0637 family)
MDTAEFTLKIITKEEWLAAAGAELRYKMDDYWEVSMWENLFIWAAYEDL